MVARLALVRNAEGAQGKAALVDDGPVQRGQQYKHYNGRVTLRDGMAEEQRRREEAERERDDLRRELYAVREARESHEAVEEEPGRAEPRPATVESEEPVQRPWWRRVFGR